MVSVALLISTRLAIQTIEEAIAEKDPYNIPVLSGAEEGACSLSSCEFSDQVEDPLAIVRLLRGDAFAKQLEYEDHLEFILYHLHDCLKEELTRREQRGEPDPDDCYTSDCDEGTGRA